MSPSVLDRIRFETIPSPQSVENTSNGRTGNRMRRAAYGIVVLASVATALGGVWWGHYRYGHIVSRNASVKGHVAQVGGRFDGVVQYVAIEDGERVSRGDVLARLDDRHLIAAKNKAQAEVERAKKQLHVERLAIEQDRQFRNTQLVETRAATDARVARLAAAQSEAEKAHRDRDRIAELGDRGASANVELADAETTLRTAMARVSAAQADQEAARAAQAAAQIELNSIAVREEALSVYESHLKVAQATLDETQANLEAAIIRAPNDGRVIRRIVEAGASVRVGQPIVELLIGDEVWIEAWIDETDLAQVQIGTPAVLTVEPFADRALRGRVDSIGMLTSRESPEEEIPRQRQSQLRDTTMVKVRVTLDEIPDVIFPGLSASVSFPKRAPGFFSNAPPNRMQTLTAASTRSPS